MDQLGDVRVPPLCACSWASGELLGGLGREGEPTHCYHCFFPIWDYLPAQSNWSEAGTVLKLPCPQVSWEQREQQAGKEEQGMRWEGKCHWIWRWREEVPRTGDLYPLHRLTKHGANQMRPHSLWICTWIGSLQGVAAGDRPKPNPQIQRPWNLFTNIYYWFLKKMEREAYPKNWCLLQLNGDSPYTPPPKSWESSRKNHAMKKLLVTFLKSLPLNVLSCIHDHSIDLTFSHFSYLYC